MKLDYLISSLSLDLDMSEIELKSQVLATQGAITLEGLLRWAEPTLPGIRQSPAVLNYIREAKKN